MKVSTQLHRFLLFILLVLQSSCRTSLPLQPQRPEQAHETAQPPGAEAPGTQQESAKVDQESKKAGEPPARKPKETLPESVLDMPEKDLASPALKYDTVVLTGSVDPAVSSGWQYRINRQKQIVGFEFSNRGGNPILPDRYDIEKNRLFTRDFQFRFEERARQDIHLEISDWAPSRDKQFRLSELMNSVMFFFPRNYLPAVVSLRARHIITLPTGEEVEFDAKTHEVLGGVFSEAPVDLNPDKTARKFPAINYVGKGVVVRANSRGMDPRIGTTALITTGSPAPDCKKGTACHQCTVPAKELWDQKGAVRFKFPTDQEFDRYLVARCGFGLPAIDFHFAIASSLK